MWISDKLPDCSALDLIMFLLQYVFAIIYLFWVFISKNYFDSYLCRLSGMIWHTGKMF